MQNIIEILETRGFIEAITHEEIRKEVEKPLTLYVGFDPTSDSLHLGNMVAIMGLAWFQKMGHKPIALVGGATGMIGDPSGKSKERNLLDSESIEHNLKGIECSLQSVLGSDVRLLNNYDWFKKISYLDFLREYGKFFRMGTMLGKESVKTRLASEEGISYTEFSYQLLQAYDFLHLFDHHQVTLQMGGSDQWGNITAGTELVRKVRDKIVYGLTFPLLTRSDGKKFGKSEGGAIWLNRDKLSPYEFYQYLFRLPDADLPKLFRLLTFMELEEIEGIEADMEKKTYVPNTAQKRLAEEITRLVHGEEGLKEALRVTLAAKPGSTTELNRDTLEALTRDMPSLALEKKEIFGKKIIDLLMICNLFSSKSEARRMIAAGGVYLNNIKVIDEALIIDNKHVLEDQYVLITLGKKKKIVVKIS